MNSIHSPGSVQAHPHGASIVQVESPRAVAIMVALTVVSIAIACVALSIAFATWTIAETRYREVSTDVRLQRMETDELGAAVARAGISTHREDDAP